MYRFSKHQPSKHADAGAGALQCTMEATGTLPFRKEASLRCDELFDSVSTPEHFP